MQMFFIQELCIDAITKQQIAALLQICFPEVAFNGRTYFKQLPHYRLLLKENEQLLAQVGLDYRVMTLNAQAINVLGIIDLAVTPEWQGKGIGTKLLKAVDQLVNTHIHNVDFLFLVADKHQFYEKNGYHLTQQTVKWLAMEEHTNYGIKEQYIDDCLMYKQVGQAVWIDNAYLDMLGYWY
ncbi:MAG: GNAT family N-acetyltransferase [Chitinophagales bacterium]|nr:GNAT family N-acetyltransferase [Chitinophagales bacterium]